MSLQFFLQEGTRQLQKKKTLRTANDEVKKMMRRKRAMQQGRCNCAVGRVGKRVK